MRLILKTFFSFFYFERDRIYFFSGVEFFEVVFFVFVLESAGKESEERFEELLIIRLASVSSHSGFKKGKTSVIRGSKPKAAASRIKPIPHPTRIDRKRVV